MGHRSARRLHANALCVGTIFAATVGVLVVLSAPTTALARGTITVITSSRSVGASSSRPSAAVTARSVEGHDALERLAARITRRLGDADSKDRVKVTRADDELEVAWSIARPPRKRPDHELMTLIDARRAQLRRDLGRVLRTLVSNSAPSGVNTVHLVASSGGLDVQHAVLDAHFVVETLDAIQSDDVRLRDATLEELLGLAYNLDVADGWLSTAR